MPKTVLIIGACSDIGSALAVCFSGHGLDLQLAARNMSKLEAISEGIRSNQASNVSLYELDVLAYDTHTEFVNYLPTIPDVVISVVGLLGDQNEAQNDWQHSRLIMETNYFGPASILEKFSSIFEQRKSGCIIGISSVAGERGRKSNYIYGSSKSGFTSYLSGLRNRLHESHVDVITVLPGFVKTTMTKDMNLPPLLTASPEQVAGDIYNAYAGGKNILYTRWYWRWIMYIIKAIPESIFKKMSL